MSTSSSMNDTCYPWEDYVETQVFSLFFFFNLSRSRSFDICFVFPARLEGWAGHPGHLHHHPPRRPRLLRPHLTRHTAAAPGDVLPNWLNYPAEDIASSCVWKLVFSKVTVSWFPLVLAIPFLFSLCRSSLNSLSAKQPFHDLHLCQRHLPCSLLAHFQRARTHRGQVGQQLDLWLKDKCFQCILWAANVTASVLYGCLKIRYIAFVNSSASACLGIHVLGVFLLAAPWYNFLGEHFLNSSSQLCRKKFIQKYYWCHCHCHWNIEFCPILF